MDKKKKPQDSKTVEKDPQKIAKTDPNTFSANSLAAKIKERQKLNDSL